jgi:hypothetical protein
VDDDYELNEAIERLAMAAKRWEYQEAERLLEEVEPQPAFLYSPDTEHPAYAKECDSIRRFMAKGLRAVRIPVMQKLSWAEYSPANIEPVSSSLDVRTLDVRRAWGPAPYVGRPFAYMWDVAMDEFGRWVAGPSEIKYLPEDFKAAKLSA